MRKYRSVSIITLAYESFEDLFHTIASVFEQKLDDIDYLEYFIVDDGSKSFDHQAIDDFVGGLNSVKNRFNRICIYSNEINLGTVRSFNRAVSKCKGDIIIPLSSGDRFHNVNSVSLIAREFNERQCDILTAKREIVDGDVTKCVEPSACLSALFDSEKKDELLTHLVLYGNFISGACTYYNIDFLHEIGGFDESFRLLEDFPLYLKVLNDGGNISFFDVVTMKHSVGGVSDSTHPINPMLRHDFDVLNKWILDNVSLSFYKRRMFYFFKVMKRRERLTLKSFIKYPDCFVLWLYKRYFAL